MKKISIVCLSGLLFFAACENTGSSSVGTYEKEESTQSTEKTENASHEQQVLDKSENLSTDTSNSAVTPSRDGLGNEVKTGSHAAADSNRSAKP